MKKQLILIVTVLLLFTSCANSYTGESLTSKQEELSTESVTTQEELSTESVTTKVPSFESDTSTLNNETENFIDPENFHDDFGTVGIFHLQDFYTFAQTGSVNPEDYESSKFKNRVHTYYKQWAFEERELIKLEDLGFSTEAIMDDFDCIYLHTASSAPNYAHYDYHIKSIGDLPLVRVKVAPNEYKTNDVSTYIAEYKWIKGVYDGGFKACLESATFLNFYLEKIGDCTVAYSKQGLGDWCLYFVVDGVYVEIASPLYLHDNLDDPLFAEIARFFCEDTYLDAVQQAIDGIKNRD